MPVNWNQIEDEILSKLNIAAEYKALGVKIVSRVPNQQGWLGCFAVNREDKRQSAAINVKSGVYTDRGAGERLRFWEFAARFNKDFANWREARKHYAHKVGVKLPQGRQEKSPGDYIKPVPFSAALVKMFLERRKGITIQAIKDCGGFLAMYPANAPAGSRNLVIAFPVIDPTTKDRAGYAVVKADGRDLPLYRGKGAPPEMRKLLLTPGTKPGFIGQWGINYAEHAKAIWKVEGLTDLLALQSIIPDSHKKNHVVVTNAFGAVEEPLAEWLPFFKGKKTILCGDCDMAGQYGVKKWSTFLPAALVAKLPYPVEEKHGKDLRDFIVGGGTYKQLCELVDSQTEPAAAPPTRKEPEEKTTPTADLLSLLRIDVLGEYADGSIEAFSRERKKLFTIKSIRYFGFADLLQCAGEIVMNHVHDGKDTVPGKVNMAHVKNALALEAGRFRLSQRTTIGAGVWKVEGFDDIVLVDSGCAARWDGSSLSLIDRPRIGTQVMDFAAHHSWCDFGSLGDLLDRADPDFSVKVYEKLKAIFSKWSWRVTTSPNVLAALVMATWVQTLWPWRPLVAITGPSDAGKSTLLDTLLQSIFGSLTFYAQKPTEAGIRQHVRHNAFAVLLDELEHDAHRNRVMELLRTSSRGGNVVRGSSSQRGIQFTLRHIVWMTAIESGLKREPDKNRFITLELFRPESGVRGKLTLPPAETLRLFGQESLAVALRNVDKAIYLHNKLKSLQIPGVSGRLVETYSVPSAMISAIYRHSDEESENLLRQLTEDRLTETSVIKDEESLLQDLLGSQFYVGGGKHCMVAEVITNAYARQTHSNDLERQGVAIVNGKRSGDNEAIFIAPDLVQRNLLRSTRFGSGDIDIKQILRRIEGAALAQRSIHGHRVYGVDVPMSRFLQVVNPAKDVEYAELEK